MKRGRKIEVHIYIPYSLRHTAWIRLASPRDINRVKVERCSRKKESAKARAWNVTEQWSFIPQLYSGIPEQRVHHSNNTEPGSCRNAQVGTQTLEWMSERSCLSWFFHKNKLSTSKKVPETLQLSTNLFYQYFTLIKFTYITIKLIKKTV